MFDDYKTKDSVVVVYTGEGKGKTSASLGLMARALGAGWKVAYIQFIKSWKVNEHQFIATIQPLYKDKLFFYKGGAGFYNAGKLSAKDVTNETHHQMAAATLAQATQKSTSGQYDLVICDEINNAVNDGLITADSLAKLVANRSPKTSLCLTGRDYPKELLGLADIATNMTKIKHHFDDKFLANSGIDF
jgi:cob(I)alamin adenosyltransferase